jgi:precorrin-2 dehydrogenase/sirohydrochlorin ferrochelatase
MPNYYPIMLDVRGRKAIVIGGDRIAAEKAAALHASGAQVTVISPKFGKRLQAQSQNYTLLQKDYQPGDLEGAFVVVAAITEPELIEAVWQETQERSQLVNIVDVPARCNFILPSILRRDQLTIAVSTEGASPSLAKRIRQQLEKLFPPTYGLYLRLAAVARGHLRKQGVSYEERDEFFGNYYESDILKHLEAGDQTLAAYEISRLLQEYQIEISPADLVAEVDEGRWDNA